MGGNDGARTEAQRDGGTKGRAQRGDWAFRAVIVLMAAVFVTTIVERNRIRAHWWAMRLTRSERAQEQSYYLSCLIGTGGSGLGAVERLGRDERAAVRLMAVSALRSMETDAGREELEALARDADEKVRESAALGLALRGNDESLAALRALARSENEDVAASATAALGRTRDAESLAAICEAALHHKSALVRAQAAEALADVVISIAGSEGSEAELRGPAATSQTAMKEPHPIGTSYSVAPQPLIEGRETTTRRIEGGCDPAGTIKKMIDDKGEFARWLSLERQKAAAAAFAKTDIGMAGAPPKRTVGDVAREMLQELSRKN